MKTTRYFDKQVLPRRPYIRASRCEAAIARSLRRKEQPDGRLRFWIAMELPGETKPRYLRVVTLSDGETVHNAFFDRDFREYPP